MKSSLREEGAFDTSPNPNALDKLFFSSFNGEVDDVAAEA